MAATAAVLNPATTKFVLGLSNGWKLFPLAFDVYAIMVVACAILHWRTGRKSYGVIVLILLLAVIPSMFFVEVIIYHHQYKSEINSPEYHEFGNENVHQKDPVLGWSPIPNARGREFNGENFDAVYEFDESGRKRIAQVDHASRTIHAFGDSFAFGYGVGNEQTALALLAKKLNPAINVLNYAVNGYGIEQMYLRLDSNIDAIQKGDIVLFLPTDADLIRTMVSRRWPCLMHFDRDRIETFPMLEPDGWKFVDLAKECGYVFDFLLIRSKLIFGMLYKAYIDLTTTDRVYENADTLFEMARVAVERRGAAFYVVLIARPNDCITGVQAYDWTPVRTAFTSLVRDCPTDREQAISYRFKTDGHLSVEGNKWLAGSLERFLREAGQLQ